MKNKSQLSVLVVCCCIIAASIGMLTNSAGVFFTPIAEDLGVGKGAVSMSLTLANIAYAFGGLMTVKVIHENNFKKMVFLFGTVYAISTALLSIAQSVFLLYVFSLIRGASTGIAGMVLVTILINNHYKEGVGFATSIALGFSGISGALLSLVFSWMIGIAGWRLTYVVEGILAFLLYLPCMIGPVSLNNRIKEDSVESKDTKTSTTGIVPLPIFIMVCAYTFLIASVTALPQHFPSLASTAAVGSLMVSVTMVMNTAGKIILGAISDKVGAEKALEGYGVLVVIGLLVLVTFKSHPIFSIIGAILVGLVYAMAAVGPVLLSQNLFRESYNAYYPKVSLVGTISNALFTTAVGFVYDIANSYDPALWLAALFAIIAIGTLVYANKIKS